MPKQQNIFSILVGGAAGDGAREATANLSRLLTKIGFEVIQTVEYPSLIRGGHNFARVTFSDEKIYCDYEALDILVALNKETADLHLKELKKGGLVIFDCAKQNKNIINLPLCAYAKEMGAPPILRTAAALGAVCWIFNFDLRELNTIFEEIFKDKAEGKKVSIIYPGGGYFYTGHPILGFGDAITELVLMILVVASLFNVLKGNESGISSLIFYGILLFFEKVITVYHSNHFINEYIPKEKEIKPIPIIGK